MSIKETKIEERLTFIQQRNTILEVINNFIKTNQLHKGIKSNDPKYFNIVCENFNTIRIYNFTTIMTIKYDEVCEFGQEYYKIRVFSRNSQTTLKLPDMSNLENALWSSLNWSLIISNSRN